MALILTPPQKAILDEIKRSGGAGWKRVAPAGRYEKMAQSNTLLSLLRQKILRVDRKADVYCVTAKGDQILAEVAEADAKRKRRLAAKAKAEASVASVEKEWAHFDSVAPKRKDRP